jgi:hypothetical protein
MINYVLGLWANKWLAFVLYYIPMVLCAWGYFWRTYRNVQKDKKARETPSGYVPTDTIGSLIGRAILIILPVGNLLAGIFDVGPEVFGAFFNWLGEVFSQPLVPDLPNGPALRAQKLEADRMRFGNGGSR